MHVETLLLLCHTRWGRDFLREHGVYEIVRATHENETVDKVHSPSYIWTLLIKIPSQISEHIERLVTLLKGDEPSDPRALEEVENTDIDSTVAISAVANPTSGLIKDPMSDDEDNVIEEV